jgi:thioredoxin 1
MQICSLRQAGAETWLAGLGSMHKSTLCHHRDPERVFRVERHDHEDKAMNAPKPYSSDEPARAEVDAMAGSTVLEFGANWCGICQAAQPDIGQALASRPALRHLKIEDGRGRPLGRSFGVKLWPTLVMLQDGREVARVVRPGSSSEVADALARLG